MKQRLLAAIAVGVSSIATAAIFFRLAAPTPPLVAAGLRLAMASLLLSPMVWRCFVRGEFEGRGAAVAGAGFFYALHFGAWVTSLSLTSVAASVTLVTATPLLLAVVALVRGKDRASRRQWQSLGVAVIGLGILGGGHGGDAIVGDALAFLGAAAMGGYFLIAREHAGAISPWAFVGAACAGGAVLLLGAAVLLGLPLLPPTAEAAGYLLLATLIPQLLGHGALTWALRYTSPTTVGLATVGEPVISTMLAFVFLGEFVGLQTLVGCAVTATAVLLSFAPRKAPVETGERAEC